MGKLKNSFDQEGTWHTHSETGTHERDRDMSARKFEWGEHWEREKNSARQFLEGNQQPKKDKEREKRKIKQWN